MKFIKILPLSAAISLSLGIFGVSANDAEIEALTDRIQELEQKLETGYVYDQQPADLTPDFEPPKGVIFSGYARYGAHHVGGDKRYVQVGTSGVAVGRLGNEAHGGEFQLARAIKTDSGAIWDVVLMIDHWADDAWNAPGGLDLKKAYAGVTNVIPGQPELYFWGGRDFHQRPQQEINDYTWMTHDGQGGGFKNLDLGGAKFNLAFVGAPKYGSGGTLVNDSGVYAITSKLHSIDTGIGYLDLFANYGFASSEAGEDKEDETSWQLAAEIGLGESDRVILRYSDGADDSSFDLAGDVQAFYATWEGNYNYGNPWALDYLASYKKVTGADAVNLYGMGKDERSEYSAIVRPMYSWNDVHSTWFEAGYAMEDYENGDEVTGWKATISQNISLGGMPWSRPMLRLYATFGEVDDESSQKHDTKSVGVMYEAWW